MEYEEFCDMVSENARAKHRVYLNSNEWKEKREIILKRDNYLCQDCLKVSALVFEYLKKNLNWLKDLNINFNIKIKASQVHHLNYGSLHTSEEINDCISLCGLCHQIKHSGLKYDYNRISEIRFNNILRILYNRILKNPLIIEIGIKQHDEFIKSLILKPNDWLKEKINEVENGKNN